MSRQHKTAASAQEELQRQQMQLKAHIATVTAKMGSTFALSAEQRTFLGMFLETQQVDQVTAGAATEGGEYRRKAMLAHAGQQSDAVIADGGEHVIANGSQVHTAEQQRNGSFMTTEAVARGETKELNTTGPLGLYAQLANTLARADTNGRDATTYLKIIAVALFELHQLQNPLNQMNTAELSQALMQQNMFYTFAAYALNIKEVAMQGLKDHFKARVITSKNIGKLRQSRAYSISDAAFSQITADKRTKQALYNTLNSMKKNTKFRPRASRRKQMTAFLNITDQHGQLANLGLHKTLQSTFNKCTTTGYIEAAYYSAMSDAFNLVGIAQAFFPAAVKVTHTQTHKLTASASAGSIASDHSAGRLIRKIRSLTEEIKQLGGHMSKDVMQPVGGAATPEMIAEFKQQITELEQQLQELKATALKGITEDVADLDITLTDAAQRLTSEVLAKSPAECSTEEIVAAQQAILPPVQPRRTRGRGKNTSSKKHASNDRPIRKDSFHGQSLKDILQQRAAQLSKSQQTFGTTATRAAADDAAAAPDATTASTGATGMEPPRR